MAATQEIDLTLETRLDYALAGCAVILSVILAGLVLVGPWYVFTALGVMYGVSNPAIFGIGGYVLAAGFLYGWVN